MLSIRHVSGFPCTCSSQDVRCNFLKIENWYSNNKHCENTAGVNVSKPLCPVFNSSAVPAIRPVALPEIASLAGGQILVGQQQLPTQIKVCTPLHWLLISGLERILPGKSASLSFSARTVRVNH